MDFTLLIPAIALAALSVLLGGSMYDAVVLGPNLHGGPDGLEHGRLFMSRATPGNLFRVAVPVSLLLLVVSVIVAWRFPHARWLLVAALALLVVADVITVTVHFPRNRLMFGAPTTVDPAALAAAAREWAIGNHARVLLVVGSWVCALLALGAIVLRLRP